MWMSPSRCGCESNRSSISMYIWSQATACSQALFRLMAFERCRATATANRPLLAWLLPINIEFRMATPATRTRGKRWHSSLSRRRRSSGNLMVRFCFLVEDMCVFGKCDAHACANEFR